jgi:hypothetical protein
MSIWQVVQKTPSLRQSAFRRAKGFWPPRRVLLGWTVKIISLPTVSGIHFSKPFPYDAPQRVDPISRSCRKNSFSTWLV